MSQAGIIDVEGSHPQIPTQFDTNSGTAVPIGNVLEILGTTVAPHGFPMYTTGSGNTVTIEAQFASTNATTDATKAGVASFNSSNFTIDANGFVSLSGTGAGETITGNIGGALTPTAGNWNIFGTSTAAGTTPVQTSGSGSTLTVQVQKSQAIASTNATNVGLAAFDSSKFTVDGNGYVSTSGTGIGQTITGNTGGALSPTAGNWNILGTGSITIAGSGSTETVQLTGLTNNNVLYGLGTATIGLVAAVNNGVLTTGTSGTPVITALASNGQVIIGSGSGAPAAATLTAGTGITITNAANSITIAATGGSFAWVDVTTATQTLAVQTGYVTDHTNVTYTLPATAALGDQIRIVGKLGITTIAQNAGQQITISSASSTVGVSGSVNGTNVGDCIWLVCVTAGSNTVWRAESFVGNWTVT